MNSHNNSSILKTCTFMYTRENHSNDTVAMDTALVTVAMVSLFVVVKTSFDLLKKVRAKITVIVIGAGPVGLLAALIASRSCRVEKIVMYEEKKKRVLVNCPQQLAFDADSISFLKSIQINFGSIEGCWDNSIGKEIFYTKTGVFQEHLVSILALTTTPVEMHLGKKFSSKDQEALSQIKGRKLVVVADGNKGRTAAMFGLQDLYRQIPCKLYGAMAHIEKSNEQDVPTPEIAVDSLTFDLSSFYGKAIRHHPLHCDKNPGPGFRFKIFGSKRRRQMSLVVPKYNTPLIRTLKTTLNQSIMRNTFKECFNNFKSQEESKLTDIYTTEHLKYNPRLFNLKIYQREKSVAYIQCSDVFVLTEGEATSMLNFHTGLDINLAMPSLKTFDQFIALCTQAQGSDEVSSVVQQKTQTNNSLNLQVVETIFRQLKEK